MTPLEQYIQDFLKPAHPTRWSMEPTRAIRRDMTSWYQWMDKEGKTQYRQFRRNALDHQIEMGYREILNWRDETVATPKLWRLRRNNWQIFRCNVDRPLGQKITKHWLLTTYPEDQPVNFIQFDLDRHYWDGMTPEEKLQVDHQFERNLENLRVAGQSIGFDFVLTSSPGDMYDGQWIHGAYAWIKLDNPLDEITVGQLRPLIRQFCDYWGLETEDQDGHVSRIEFSWDKKHRLIRLPGQYRVELLDPETLEIAHPAEKPNETLAWFMDAWVELKPVQPETLFAECLKEAETKKAAPLVAQSSSSAPVILPPVPAPIIRTTKSKALPPSQSCSHVQWSLEQCLTEQNTFTSATQRKICHDLAWQYDGNREHLDQAVTEGMVKLRQCRPSTSKTCSDPLLLHNTMHRWSGYYFEFHDAYRLFTEKRIGSHLARKYQGDRRYLDVATDEALNMLRPFLKDYSPAQLSKLRHRIKDKWLNKFYFASFDSAKAKGAGTKGSRDKADRDRLGDSLGLDVDLMLRVAGRCNGLSYNQKSEFQSLLKKWKQYKGRIAAKKLYGDPGALFTKSQWFGLFQSLKGILKVVDGHDIDHHKCRQWGLTESFVKQVGETESIRRKIKEMVEEDREKEVYVTTSQITPPDDVSQSSTTTSEVITGFVSDICDYSTMPMPFSSGEHCALTA